MNQPEAGAMPPTNPMTSLRRQWARYIVDGGKRVFVVCTEERKDSIRRKEDLKKKKEKDKTMKIS